MFSYATDEVDFLQKYSFRCGIGIVHKRIDRAAGHIGSCVSGRHRRGEYGPDLDRSMPRYSFCQADAIKSWIDRWISDFWMSDKLAAE